MMFLFQKANGQPRTEQKDTNKIHFSTKEDALIQFLYDAPDTEDKKVKIFDRELDPRIFSNAEVLQALKIFFSHTGHTVEVITEKTVDDFNVKFYEFLNLLLSRPHKAQVSTAQHTFASSFMLCGDSYYYQGRSGIVGVEDSEVLQNLRNHYAVLSENAIPMQLPEVAEPDSPELVK